MSRRDTELAFRKRRIVGHGTSVRANSYAEGFRKGMAKSAAQIAQLRAALREVDEGCNYVHLYDDEREPT